MEAKRVNRGGRWMDEEGGREEDNQEKRNLNYWHHSMLKPSCLFSAKS